MITLLQRKFWKLCKTLTGIQQFGSNSDIAVNRKRDLQSKKGAGANTYKSAMTCLSASLVLLVVSGCTSTKGNKFKDEEFGANDVFTHSFPGTEKSSCESARRALLSQGYVISEAKTSYIKGRRKFQHENDLHAEIEFNVVCASDSKGSNSTTVFANAVRDRYSLKRNSTNASIGVGGIGSVSLPFGASDDSLVKVASETISAKDFYSKFFDLMERYLDGAIDATEELEKKETPEVVIPKNLRNKTTKFKKVLKEL